MSRPTLSICIPTHRRAEILRGTLNHLLEQINFPFSYEICVSDNASEDGTAEVVAEFIGRGHPVKYRKNVSLVSGIVNFSNAIRLGSGDFLIVMADDDRLIPDELTKIVHFLEINENFVAAFAPFEYYSEAKDSTVWFSRDITTLPEITILSVNNVFTTLDFFLDMVSPPEILIYRSRVSNMAFSDTQFCYNSYFDMTSLLLQGDVAYFRQPFYRWVTEFATPDGRIHASIRESRSGWSEWRGGMEEMINILLKRANIDIDGEIKNACNSKLNAFELRRMEVALNTYLHSNELLKAYEVFSRMKMLAKLNNIDLSPLKNFQMSAEKLPGVVPWIYVIGLINNDETCDGVYLYKQDVEVSFADLEFGFRVQNVKVPVYQLSDTMFENIDLLKEEGKSRFIIVRTPIERERLLENSTYPAGQVLDMQTIALRFPF